KSRASTCGAFRTGATRRRRERWSESRSTTRARVLVKRLRVILLAAALVLFSAAHARAAAVAILRPRSSAPEINEALFRLKGELLAVGLDVTLAERPPGGATAAH